MASETGTLYIKSADWTQNIYEDASYSFSTSEPLSECLSTNAPTVTAVALTIGWTAISDSTSMGDLFFTSAVSGTLTLYDVTPEPETITWFFLDGSEYKFAWWWGWWWWRQLAPNSPLTPTYDWYGTEEQYEALTQYYTDTPNDTVYHTI